MVIPGEKGLLVRLVNYALYTILYARMSSIYYAFVVRTEDGVLIQLYCKKYIIVLHLCI